MSTALPPPIRLIAQPWLWILAGFSLTIAAAGIHALGASTVVGGIAVAGGLFCVGIGVAIRLQASDCEDFRCASWLRSPCRWALSLFQVGVIAMFSWMLLAAILGIDPFGRNPPNLNSPMDIKIGPMVIAWVLVVPLTLLSLRTIWRAPVPGSVETGAMLMVVCGIVVLVGRSLPVAADTLRFFFAVSALAIAFGVSLVTASIGVRYAALSLLATFHFLAIFTATMASPPTPWLATQVWQRIAHPYLEFMYLNNAYHFYSPEPGATTHFWMCVYYETGKSFEFNGEKRDELDPVWVKLPDVDNEGRQNYPVSLEYQRILTLTENITPPDPSPPLYLLDGKGQITAGPLLKNRLLNSPSGESRGTILGKDAQETEQTTSIPLTPGMPPESQYQKPAGPSMRLMESLVRYAAARKHPTHPEWKVNCVRAYRALHTIPPWPVFMYGGDPNDPVTFRVTFSGTFDPVTGKLDNPDEPLLNWIIPMTRARAEHPDSPVFCWYLFHAGERRFIYRPDTKEYVPLSPELLRQFPAEWTKDLHKFVPPDWVNDWK
jgi:hypothetical protein